MNSKVLMILYILALFLLSFGFENYPSIIAREIIA